MTLDELIKDLRTMPYRMRTGAYVGLYSKGNEYLKKFERKSPVDTGEYRNKWRMNKGYQGKVAIKIYNEDDKAHHMEFGQDLDEKAPWYFPKGKRKSKSKKLYVSGGRIWAGGVNPGAPITKGGAIDPIVYNNEAEKNRLTKAIAENIIKRIK